MGGDSGARGVYQGPSIREVFTTGLPTLSATAVRQSRVLLTSAEGIILGWRLSLFGVRRGLTNWPSSKSWAGVHGLPGSLISRFSTPSLNEEYATRIARDWNVKASGVGYVTRFEVEKAFLDRYEVQQAGGQTILEYWIPAEDLADFNQHIVGLIEVVSEFR